MKADSSDEWVDAGKKPDGGASTTLDGVAQHRHESQTTVTEAPDGFKCSEWMKSWRMPFTLDAWRWGLQEALTIAVLMWPTCLPKVDQILFNGNGRWVVASATPVIEGTAGGTMRRMIDRVLGTLIAGCVVVSCFTVTIGVRSERTDSWVCLVALYLLISLCGFFYNWLLFRFPSHPLIGVVAAFMTPIIVGGSVFTGAAVFYASWRTVTVMCGVLASGLITRYFLPKRARVDIIINLAVIMEELAAALEPLIELESGMVSSPSFFDLEAKPGSSSEAFLTTGVKGMDSANSLFESSVSGRVEIQSKSWNKFKQKIWSRLEKCGKLTNDQLVMIGAARTEVSLRKKNTFFQEEHKEALINIRTLFYHVTSLFFLIDTQMCGLLEFSDRSLVDEVEHWSRFGVMSMKAPQRGGLCSAANLAALDSDEDNLYGAYKGRTHGHLPPRAETLPNVGTVLKEFNLGSRVAGDLNHDEEMKADVNPTLRWAQIYGPTIGRMVRHICAALRSSAQGLRDTEFPFGAAIALKRAANAISLFHIQRAERHQATSIFVEHAINGQAAGDLDGEFRSRFQQMLGLPASDYESLSDTGRAAFWNSYWTLRDRLSTTDTTVMTLFVAVRTATASVEKLIEARRQKLKQGEVLHDQLDLDRIEVEKHAAVQKAGGNLSGAYRPA